MLVKSKRQASTDIRDIELIEAVHSTGSLSKACVELSISQPTLSKRPARLESTVGAELFFHYSTGLVATPVADYVPAQSSSSRVIWSSCR